MHRAEGKAPLQGTVEAERFFVRRLESWGAEVVVNLFGQLYPGRASAGDTAGLRLQWFEAGLRALEQHAPALGSLGFPHRIGCGLAGGRWPDYARALESFAARVQPVRVVLCLKVETWPCEGCKQRVEQGSSASAEKLSCTAGTAEYSTLRVWIGIEARTYCVPCI